MEIQQVLILFCTLATGVSRRVLENEQHEASCMAQCTGPSVLNLPTGSRVSYKYSTSTNTFLQGRASKWSGISLEGTAVIEVLAKCRRVLKLQDVQIKTTFESREKLIKENGSLREVLERHPLWFCFHNGKIPKIFPQESEPTWALNVKRGILSVLQTSWTAAANGSVEEVDVLGKCPTKYQWKRSLLLKTKDLNLCSHRFSGFTVLRSVALPGAPQQLLSSKLECTQRFEEGILAEAKCTESNLVKGGGMKTQTQTAMKLFRMEVDAAYERVETKDVYKSNLLYERETTASLSGEDEVAEILQKLCTKPSVNSESTELFLTLVLELRRLPADALKSLWQRSSFKCRDNWQPLLDALPSCATEACVVLMKELIVSKEVEEDNIESFLWSLSFIPEPTTGMIDVLAPLLQLPRKRQSAFLEITALVHHFCSVKHDCDQEPAVRGVIRILGGHLGRKCTLHESEGIGEMELILKAIGNAGLAATHLTPVLSSCAMLKSSPLEIRLAAVEAFRRIPCAANHTVLVHLYQTYSEDVEIRIASYLMAMKCPSEELFSQIKWTLQNEKSSQVGSFVWSHLSQLLETDDPLKQHLKNALPDDILSKEYDWETWKFSSYSDVTFHSAAASANAEARFIFSPASFIPRLIAANLTVHVLGRAINLLELGIRLENVEDVVQKFFGLHPAHGTKERNSKQKRPREAAHKTQQKKLTSERHSLGNSFPSKTKKLKPRQAKQSCSSGPYSKMSQLVKKFTKKMGRKKKPSCALSIKVFGNELTILDCGDLRGRVKWSYLNLAGLVAKLQKGQEVQFNKRLSLASEELLFPAVSGLPVILSLNASAAVQVTIKGNIDFKQLNHFFINGYIKPSAHLHISVHMGTVGTLGKTGLKWATELRSLTSLDGGIQAKKGKEFKVFLNTPEEFMEVVYFSSLLYITTADERETAAAFPGHLETKSCSSEEVSKMFGWQLCSEISKPNADTGNFIFPLPGPVKVAITLKKQDKSLHQYLMKAAYNYISQKGSCSPDEVGLHFFMGTPKSDLKRDVAMDLYVNIPQKNFRIECVHPKKKMQMRGKIEASRNSRVGHLELILDDSDIYYIKGRTDLQTVAGEQRYSTQLEAKLLKNGSPIVLTGNVTKQPGKKMALSVSLINLLKDAAFLSICLEKKADDKLRQYSLEGETHVPGVLGSYIIGLLQQQGSLWSNGLRIKYGLFEDAKNLQHECNMGQKLKVKNGPHATYGLDLEHELYCTQVLAYNHKVNLHHEETASQLHSKLEVSYGKHWDEINNKKRILASQTFKNNSSPTVASYFMEFTVQVPDKQVDHRTQLQHTHSRQSYMESSTNFKVQYNNYMPFVAELHWKDTSRHYLKKWEGTFNMNTPWLYLYVAHKLHQLRHSAFSASLELTTGKAFIIKGLVVEIFCKDKDNEKEGKIWIHTPTTTYLRASTINHFERDFLHSQSEVVSMWNQLVKNEIYLESSEQTKNLHFKIKSAKQEFNMTAAYFHLEVPKKTNVSMGVLWTDHKNLPIVLQFEAQIEEVRKERLLYQKCGTIQFRHPFKLPIPQSLLLQGTFTVNKKEKHYFLETKILINGLEESVQTLILGYQAENPYICAELVHPYNSKIFPQNILVCAATRNLSRARCEVEATLKINKKDLLSFLGTYHNKSNVASSQHFIQMDMTQLFQLTFPQSMSVNGELFCKETKLASFDWGLTVNATINKQDTSQFRTQLNGSDTHFGIYSQLSHQNQSNSAPGFQVHATANRNVGNSFNGSFYLHSSGKDLVLLEASFHRKMKKNARAIGLSAVLRQAIITQLQYLCLQLVGKILPSRLLLSSVMKLNQNSVHLGVTGSKEQKSGLVLTLHGSVRHNVDGLKHVISPYLALNVSLMRKNNIHEGIINAIVNRSEYGLRVQNRNVFGNASFHNITVAVTQNGSRAFPSEAKLRGQLELSRGLQRGSASIQVDTRAVCIDLSSIVVQEQMGATGTLTHNLSALHAAGLPRKSSITAMYSNITTNRTITLQLQGGNKTVNAALGVEELRFDVLSAQLTATFNHNIMELKRHGIPFSMEGACYYQNSSKKFSVGATLQIDKDHFRVQLETQGTNSTAGLVLFLHHDMGFLLRIIPAVLEVQCNGESTSNRLSSYCSGEFASHSFETPARISFRGSVFTSNCTAKLMGEVSSDAFAQAHIHAACTPEHSVEVSFRHAWSYLRSLGLPQENRIKVAALKDDEYRGLLEATFGECVLTANGELSMAGNITTAEWRVVLLNKSDVPKKADVPHNLVSGGSCLISIYNVSLTLYLWCDDQAADLQLEMSSTDKYTIEGTLSHSLSCLHELGLPPENLVLLSVTNSSILEGLLLLHADSCKVKAQGEFKARNRTEWTLALEPECKSLQDLGIPSHSQLTGSIWKDGCQVEFLSTLRSEGKGAHFKVRTECQPKVTLEVELKHELSLLRKIPEENKLSVNLGKQICCDISLQLQSGPCELQASLDFDAENQFQWQMSVVNDCKVIQDSGIPLKIEGSGHIVVDKMNLDSQMWVTAGENTICGLLILKVTDAQQELHALLTHNIKGTIHLGIPTRTVVDLILEKRSSIRKRFLQFSMDNKQITEELSFTQKSDHISVDYKLMHNLETLRALWIEDQIELQLTLLEILSENKTEGSLKLACDPNLSLLLAFSAQTEPQSEELSIKCLQNLPFLLQYLPTVAEVSSKINYSTKEAEGKLFIQLENQDFLVLTNVTFTGSNYTHVLQLTHTVAQLKILPRQFILTSAYQKSKKLRALRSTALWDGKEVKFASAYTGLLPKVSGAHDVKVEICHPFSITFPQHSTLKMHVKHSRRSHKDDIVIGWDSQNQVLVSSSLKFKKDHVNYHASIAHPFKFSVNQIEVSSLTESRRGIYNQQMQLAWNDGQPAHLTCTFRDTSKTNVTSWDACVMASSGQLQSTLAIGSLQVCGIIKQTSGLFNQHLDVKWDGKEVKQNLTYEKSKPLHLDKIQLEAILDNVFLTPCSSQHVLGIVETDYSTWLNYSTSLGTCGLSNAIALFGKHQLNKGDLLLLSEGKLSFADDEGSISMALKNHSNAKMKNYSVEFALKASEAVWLDVTGSLTSSADQSQIVVEGIIDPKEKVKLAASKGKTCLLYYMGYLKGNLEDGLEFAACMANYQQAALNAYLIVNGTMREEMGSLVLEASNQSLTLKAHGCGDPVVKIESKLNEIASTLQHRLLAKIKRLEERVWDFGKSVQHTGFLYDSASWLSKAFQEAVEILQIGMKGVAQMWKQSGVKQVLQNSLPRYLGKLQDVVQQIQTELQKPLTTLKDAYYDVTLKPLDEVWQQKTEEHLKNLQAFVPTIVKDVWLMEPIQVSLRILKTGLDVATQQMLGWAEGKFSRAASKIQKALSNLYSFSNRNCSVAIRLPVAPKGEPALNLASVTNYVIEESLMKPLRNLYNINPAAEYYRFKQRMMESPFEHHALLMGNKHLRTFDGQMYSLFSKCSVLLAKDFVRDAFTVILNWDSRGAQMLHIDMNGTSIIIYPEQKTYMKYNYSLTEENCQRSNISLEENGIAVRREPDYIEVSSTNRVLFACDLHYELCTLTMDGWHHGASAGLFGTNDNEAGNEWMLPDHSYTESLQEFAHRWQVSSQCSQTKTSDKQCPGKIGPQICKAFFQDSHSSFRNCFKVVDPEPFYNLCTADMCEPRSVKPACTLAAAFVHLCNRNFVPLGMPLPCDGELRLRDGSWPVGTP